MAEQATKPKKSRSRKDAKVSQAAGQTERLKTVVRRLPPNLPEEIFWQSVQEWVTDETVTWKVFRPGKMRKKFYKENIPSRAYIAFKSEELLAAFGQAYDGHLFRDKAGNESYAIVEFAPCQKIPSEKKKVDPRNATIEQDEDYISFIQSLNAPPTKPAEADTLEALIAASRPPPQPESTPLLEALKAERSAAKDKEAILRNHAHYHQGLSSAPSTAKDQSKKGVAAKAADDSHGKKGGRGKKDKADASKGTPTQIPAAAGSSSAPQDTKGGKVSGVQGKPIPKGPKAARDKKPEPEAKKVPTVKISTSSAHGEADQSGNADNASPTTPRERRSRPVLGLASRQFEAALSGVGVPVGGGGGGGGGERRARLEKEKKGGADAGQGNDGGNVAGGGSGGQGAGSVRDNPGGGRGGESSRRSRGGGRGGGRRRDGSDGESISSASHGAAPPPTILHRNDAPANPPKILSRNFRAEGSQQQPTTPVTSDAQSQGSQGTGRGRGGKHRGGGPDDPGHRADGDGGGGGGGGRGDGGRGRRRARGRGM